MFGSPKTHQRLVQLLEVAFLDGIEMAVPVLRWFQGKAGNSMGYVWYQSGEWLFNDQIYPNNGIFDNPGTESWQREGADIRLVDVETIQWESGYYCSGCRWRH